MRGLLLSLAVLAAGAIHAAKADDPPPAAADLIAARQSGMAMQATVIAAILQAIAANAGIKPGQRLVLPAGGQAPAEPAPRAPLARALPQPTSGWEATHTLQGGESLYSVARNYRVTLAELQRYDVGRLKPGTDHAKAFPEQRPIDGARIPTLTELFDLVKRIGADQVRFNIETKITPTSGAETPDPEAFARAFARAVRDAGLVSRASIQSFDWRTLAAMRRTGPSQ